MNEPDRRAHDELAAAYARLKERCRELQSALAQSEGERRLLLDSKSWKLTRPLRWARRVLSGGTLGEASAGRPVQRAAGRTGGAAAPVVPPAIEAWRTAAEQRLSNETYRLLQFDRVGGNLGLGEVESGRFVPVAPGHDEWRGGDTLPLCRIGFIGGRELREELAFDAVVRAMPRMDWQEPLQSGRLDLLLVEACWDPDGGWRFALLGVGPEADELRALLARARELAIPTALWVRDAAEAAPRFAWLMPLFDAVYGIDEAVCKRLRQAGATLPVRVLAPAIQPRLHNPVRSRELADAAPAFAGKVLFDGWWELAGGLGDSPALSALAGDPLLVVDSEWEVGGVRLDDLPTYAGGMLGCVSGLEKSWLQRLVPVEYRPSSTLLPSWRLDLHALRASASGAVVVADDPGVAIPSVLGPGVDPARTIAGLLGDPLSTSRLAHLGFRETIKGHTLRHRLRRVLADLGISVAEEASERVAAVLVSMRPDLLEGCIRRFREQDHADTELVVVVHGAGGTGGLRRHMREGETLIDLGRERSLADCLNFALAHTDAPYWAKIDDDDHYGPSYLSDMMLYRRTSHARVWGKPPMFLHTEQHDELAWDPVWAAHANLLHRAGEATAALVAGGTLAGCRDVLEDVRFPRRRRGGSDSEFIRQCYGQGIDVLSTDGFNFVRYRHGDPGFHTWRASTEELRERTTRLGHGAEIGRYAFA